MFWLWNVLSGGVMAVGLVIIGVKEPWQVMGGVFFIGMAVDFIIFAHRHLK